MSKYPGFPMAVIASVEPRETLNKGINYGAEALRGDSPDGELHVNFHAVALNTERALLELAVKCTKVTAQDRYGGPSVLVSNPYVAEDRAAAYEGRFAPLKNAFTSKEDRVYALDAASMPLGDDKTTVYFALPLKEELKGADDIDDLSSLTPEAGDKLVRDNMMKLKDPKAVGMEKLHGPWLQGGAKKQYPTFLFFSMDRAYYEKLMSTCGKPLDMSSFFTPPQERPAIASDAVDTVEEFRLRYYVKLAGGDVADEPKGKKRPLDANADDDEPDTKKQRTVPNFDDEKTRSGFEDEDALMKDADADFEQ
jgi:hypothetical protein